MVAITDKSVRFTVSEYLELDRAGFFDDQRVELVKGRILKMSPQANPHRWAVSKVGHALFSRFPLKKFWVVNQGTLFLDEYGAPEPDAHVFDVPGGSPDEFLPTPFLVIEVSDRTYARDSGIKLQQYAAAGIQDYWIVNIRNNRVEVYRNPKKASRPSGIWTYTEVAHFEKGKKIKLLAYPKISISVDEILP